MMQIQWFPGHMAKARREITEKLKMVDVIIEILDARLPLSSQNPMIREIIEDKPIIMVLNKADMADHKVTRAWVKFYQDQGLSAIPVNANTGDGLKEVIDAAKKIQLIKSEKLLDKGYQAKAVRAMVVGIPNVGKSTLINRLAQRTVAATSDKPGVTKKQQWIKVGTEMELLDTPGVLWPKFDNEEIGYRLAVSGAIKEEIFDFELAGYYLVKFMMNNYQALLQERYKLDEIAGDPMDILEAIGRKRGCLRPGGVVDTNLAGEIVLRDYRSQKLGKLSLEIPQEDD